MAKFCQNCGTALGEGTKFCPGCGTPIPQAVPQQQPVQPQPPQQPQYQQPQQPVYQQPQKQYTQSQVHIPEQFAKRNAARVQQNAAPVKKKKGKGGLVAVIVILLVAVIGVVCFFGFRDGGWFRGSNSKTYDAQSMQSLLEYAQQLEESGNSEAAEAVYELIIKGGGAELIEKAHEEIPSVRFADDYKQIKDAFGEWKGGEGE